MAGSSHRDIPLITIGITCFNAQDTIGRAIDGARAQDWPRLEIIMVDDGSKDRSREIMRAFADEDSRIRLISHDTNRGYAGALNTIIDAAQGEYLAVFDDDDESVIDRVSKQWSRLKDYEKTTGQDLIFCYSNRNVVESKDGSAATMYAIGRKAVEPSGDAIADFLLWHHEDPRFEWGQFGSCTLFASRETLSRVGPLDEAFMRCAEWDLAIRLAFLGGHFIAVDEPLITQYKTRTEDKSGAIPLKYALQLREKYKSYLKKKRVYMASVAIAHARFYYATRKYLLSRIYMALACVCSPSAVLPNELAKRRRRMRTAV